MAEDVEHATQGGFADRHGDRGTGVHGVDAAGQAVRRGHGHGPDPVVAEVLLDLADERLLALALDLDGVVDGRQLAGRELDVDDGSGDLDDPAGRGRDAAVVMAVAMVGLASCVLCVSERSRRTRSRSSRG